MHLLSAWDSSWVSNWNTLCLILSFLTYDHDEVLFIKAYSLQRTTIQGGAHATPDKGIATGDKTATGDPTASVAASPQEKVEEQEHAAIDVIELTN
jgi:hypothetical protein